MKRKKHRNRGESNTTAAKLVRRNPVANSALMSKAGVHQQSHKAKRQQARIKLTKADLERAVMSVAQPSLTAGQSFAVA